MEKFMLSSSFQSLPIEIFYYPGAEKDTPTLLLLKGLYGLHVPGSASWDTDFIQVCQGKFAVICVNTARKGGTPEHRSVKEAFEGKTFEQECDDLEKAFEFLLASGKIPEGNFHILANSFGGTMLLGTPKVLERAVSVVMIGSGCGKSESTTKPLLQTLSEEEKLLSPLREYAGIFAFVRGANDTVVPKVSQNKIIASAESAKVSLVYTLPNANHDLSPTDEKLLHVNRTEFLLSVVSHAVKISRF
ncbi:MAG TPA: hypothetical protein VFM02_04315 [Candidatus Paceibacterota bacterium]|nr:hypothetical protein [Candidatus Paceibacterota bacterium]